MGFGSGKKCQPELVYLVRNGNFKDIFGGVFLQTSLALTLVLQLFFLNCLFIILPFFATPRHVLFPLSIYLSFSLSHMHDFLGLSLINLWQHVILILYIHLLFNTHTYLYIYTHTSVDYWVLYSLVYNHNPRIILLL